MCLLFHNCESVTEYKKLSQAWSNIFVMKDGKILRTVFSVIISLWHCYYKFSSRCTVLCLLVWLLYIYIYIRNKLQWSIILLFSIWIYSSEISLLWWIIARGWTNYWICEIQQGYFFPEKNHIRIVCSERPFLKLRFFGK